jgi:hypothetical protein
MDLQPTNIDENINTKLELNVIDYYCTFEYLLKYADINFPDYTSTCFCPFHENINTRAAKVFCEEHNEHLFCFAENKLYRPHHLLTMNIVPFTVSHVFSAIWTNLSNEEKSIFSTDLKYHKIEVDFSKYYSDYKKCKLSYFDLLDILKNS